MKILVICQYYYPEPFRISDICEALVHRGHEVKVVTGYPNYPEGILYEGYGVGKNIDEVINGVTVHRCCTIPRKKGIINRFLNYYSYAISSTKYVKTKHCSTSDNKPFDIVFCNQLSPVMMAYAAISYKKKYKVPAVMYCLDLWPESLISGGISRKNLIYKYYHYVSKKIYSQMDVILVSSRKFCEYINKEFKISSSKVKYLPQYAEDVFQEVSFKKQNNVFNFMFAGNLGLAQSIETILKAAILLEDKPVYFHIIGGGSEYEYLKKEGKNIKNVHFYGRKPLGEMNYFYSKADAMLVTMKDDPILNQTLPGKVQSYMAVGKPIIGAINGETKKVIEEAKCGYCGKSECAEELADNILKFISKGTDRKTMGKNSRKYYEENYRKDLFIEKLEDNLTFECIK